jgi:hypothetical protein
MDDQKSPDPQTFVFTERPDRTSRPLWLSQSAIFLLIKESLIRIWRLHLKRSLSCKNGSDVQILHDKEIRLQDGTPAYEIEAQNGNLESGLFVCLCIPMS